MRVLIIEDEPAAVHRLTRMLKELDPTLEILDSLDTVEQSIACLQSLKPDLMFLDIHLADGDSFEIFEKVQVETPVIFTTAYDEYALEAFRLNSVDYLLKPVKQQDLQKSMDKFRRVFQSRETITIDYGRLAHEMKDNKTSFQRRIVIRYGHHIKAIEIQDTAYFYIDSRITFVRTLDGKSYPVDYTLERLEELLDPVEFFRINRSCVVSYQAISQMHIYSKSRVKIELHPVCEFDTITSADRSAEFKRWLLGR